MTQQQSYSYVTLRYVHDAVTGEFVNVALLLFAPESKTLLVRTRKTISRVKDIFPDLDRSAFTSAMRSIDSAAARYSRDAERAPLLSFDLDAVQVARKILPADDSSLQWSPLGVGMDSNIQKAFERLFSRLVARYDEPATYRRSDEDVWRPVRQLLEDRDLASKFQEKTIIGHDDEISFKHAWKNGEWHVIEPISLDLADADQIKQKARRWLGHLSAVADAPEVLKPLFIVAAPADAQLHSAFEKAVAILRKAPFNPEIFEEDQVDELVDKIEFEVREHDAIT